MKYAFLVLLFAHGLIHLMGFVKAFELAEVSALKQGIAKSNGVLWLFDAMVFVLAGIICLLGADVYIGFTLLGIVLSQALIFTAWHDAKFGSIANLLLVIILILMVYS